MHKATVGRENGKTKHKLYAKWKPNSKFLFSSLYYLCPSPNSLPFLETKTHYVTLAGVGIPNQIRLVSNLQSHTQVLIFDYIKFSKVLSYRITQ